MSADALLPPGEPPWPIAAVARRLGNAECILRRPLPDTVHLRLARPGDTVVRDLPLPPFHAH
ncbi:MAG: hypothetical protein ACREDC_01960 [Bradyrhizobium sp.]